MMKLPSASAGGTVPSGNSLAVTKPGVRGSRTGGVGRGAGAGPAARAAGAAVAAGGVAAAAAGAPGAGAMTHAVCADAGRARIVTPMSRAAINDVVFMRAKD